MQTKEQKKKWYLKNKEKILAKMRADYAVNPDFYKNKVKIHSLNNVDKIKSGKQKEKNKNRTRYSLYWRWRNMLLRCNNASNKDYHNYGGRGIKVMGKLNTFHDYMEYVLSLPKPDNFEYSSKFHVDRIDNNHNYEIGNLRWVSVKENLENSRNRKNNPILKGGI